MGKSTLLINEHPLQVLPSLAVKIGLTEAIVLQQLHYWLENKNAGVIKNGEKWVFNTYAEWREQFPFWSERTIRRIFASLEQAGLVISAQFDSANWNQRKYYRIDYNKLSEIESASGTIDPDDTDKLSSSEETRRPDVNNRDYITENTNIYGDLEKTQIAEQSDFSLQEKTEQVSSSNDSKPQPAAPDKRLPLDWQLMGDDPISLPTLDEQFTAEVDLACMSICKYGADLEPLAREFFTVRRIFPSKKEVKTWAALFREFKQKGVTPQHIREAIYALLEKKYTVADPWAIRRTVVSMATAPAEEIVRDPNRRIDGEEPEIIRPDVPYLS